MKYGLIGEHLPHSFSKEIHAKIADYTYELCELEKHELDGFMTKKDFIAINVTIPYKKDVIPYLTEIDENAKKIGAVNTIINRDGALYGYNTDFFGMSALIRRIGVELFGRKVAILGTGGTSNTAIAVCEALGARQTVVVGRSAKNGAISYSDLYRDHTDVDYIINTTPCGMYPYPDGNETIAATPVDLSAFPSLKGVTDAVYNPLRPNFVMDAMEKGIPAEGGLYMLVAQAVLAAEAFTGEVFGQKETERIYRELLEEKGDRVRTAEGRA